MPKKPGGITLHDVAEHAEVSYQTVSRVVNKHPSVSPDTRQRVQSVIDKLGYKPNKLAKGLAGKQSHTLALMTFAMSQFGPIQMMLNIEREAKDLEYDLIFSNVDEKSPQPIEQQIGKALDSLIGRQVDGIVAILPVVGASYDNIVNMMRDIPMVIIGAEVGVEHVPSVVVDQRAGTRMITEHLLKLGHRRIVEITGPLNWYDAQARHEQWQKTLRDAGISADTHVEGDWTPRSGYEAMKSLFQENLDFTAVVADNDQMALGAIHALHEHNIRVPQDISVVGFDDMPEAAYFSPPLTTILQDFSELGSRAVRYLLDRVQNSNTPIHQHIISPKLIPRESTAPPSE